MIGLRMLAGAAILLLTASADDSVRITNQASLDAALASARPGARLRLASGVEFQNLTIRGRRDAQLEIVSDDPARPATIRNLLIENSTNIRLTGLRLLAANDRTWYHFNITGSDHISLSAMTFDGPGMETIQDTAGLQVRRSRNVSITRSRASNLTHAITFLDCTDVAVSDSRFFDLRSDGVRGGGNARVKITGNFFTNFHPSETRGDHPDAIQFWTANTTASATDHEISGNVIIRGATGKPIQGIFFRDHLGKYPFERVTIADNIVLGETYNAIMVDGGGTGVLSGNVVQAYPDRQSWIRTKNVTPALQMRGNASSSYLTQFAPDRSNRKIGIAKDNGRRSLQTWRTNHTVPGGFASWEELARAAGIELAVTR